MTLPYSATLPYAADAVGYFSAIADLSRPVWLDSAGLARYDILCAAPVSTLITRGMETEIHAASGVRRSAEDPLDLLRKALGTPVAAAPGIPFAGGAVGYWGYDLARRWIALPARAADEEGAPDMAIGIYDWAIVLDHEMKTARLVSWLREASTASKLPEIAARIRDWRDSGRAAFAVQGPVKSNFTRPEYEAAVGAVKRYLYAGDCYQVNLAQRFSTHAVGAALPAYLELRRISPAPHSALLDFPEAAILCASPERFLSVREGAVETRPIKGTRPRQADAREDAAMARALQDSVKDRAENLMIVDLLRNDLGKSCVPGSVAVPGLFEIERYSHVHHLVSVVTGRLAAGQDALSLLRNCFPGGSITGAPKERAMQIIEEIEPHRRGVYCGAIGYAGYDGGMDTNIAIRSLVYARGRIQFWAGGGIVADSDAAGEYAETLDKAAGMLETLKKFSAADGVS